MSPSPADRPPAMSDVAQLAGVSHQTVSRVLNEPERVRPETRERVQEAIATLGYRRNVAARVLVTRKSATIGVLVPDTSHFGPTSTLFGIENAAREAGYWISLATLDAFDEQHLAAALNHFIDQGVEAMTAIAPTRLILDAMTRASARLPVVTVTAALDVPDGVLTVFVDQVAGARAAVAHLVDLGHRRIAHIEGPADWFEAQQRVQGWRAFLAEEGLTDKFLFPGDWSAEAGYRAGAEIALMHERPTAIFAGNDQMALGAMRALRERGVDVPGDVSVVGFDDVPDSGNYLPPLTTVHQDFPQLGRRCIALLLDAIAGSPRAAGVSREERAIEPSLVVRGSTAPPGADGGTGLEHPPV